MDTKGLILVGVLLFLGGFAVFTSAPVVDHNSSVQHNEPATATVLGTEIDKRTSDGDTEYRPVVTYEYTVDSETHRSENVYAGQFDRWHGSRSTAMSVVDSYSATPGTGETTTTAYYNPDSPGEAYLRNPGWPDGWYVGVACTLVVFLGGLYLVRQGFRRWRQRTLIRNTPTESAQSLSVGPSELTGTAVPTESEPMRAPFSNEPCVLAAYEVTEYDTSGDNNSWRTVESGVQFRPFYVDDGTGQILVRPHEDTTHELEPEDWSELYVDSSERGPPSVQQFVANTRGLGFPSQVTKKGNDRKYRQNLIRPGEEVYVFGTVQPRDSEAVATGATNAERLVVEKVTDGSMRELLFFISDDQEADLLDRRRWALWRLPAGGVFLVLGFVFVVLMFAPFVGVDVPRVFDGIVDSIA